MSATRIELRGVGKSYGGQVALDDLNLAIDSGTHTAIVGPSGCGKTTALRIIAGLEAPTAGEVLLGDAVASAEGVVRVPPHQRGLTMVFQDLALWPNLTALQNVALGLSGVPLPRGERQQRAADALGMCRIGSLANRRPGELSGGQQQRVALARAFAPRPAFMLLDEPFGGLDWALKGELIEELLGLTEKWGTTLVLVTHDPEEALALCSYAFAMDGGRVADHGTLPALVAGSAASLFSRMRVRGAERQVK